MDFMEIIILMWMITASLVLLTDFAEQKREQRRDRNQKQNNNEKD